MKKILMVLLAMLMVLTACGTAATTEVASNPTTAPIEPTATTNELTTAVEPTATEASAVVPGAKYGGVLKYALMGDPQGWFPHNTVSCQNMTVMAQIWSSLLRYDGNGKLVGDLAESWEWPDSKTVIFHLRPNVKWSNGDTLTADQVVKSMEHFMNPKVSLHAVDMAKTVDHFEAVDNLSVKMVLKQTDVSILRTLTTAPGQAFILYPTYSEDTAGQSPETTIGTGPFMFKSYEPGVNVELVRNPNYFIEGLPYLDGIKYVVITDADARKTALLAGDVDVIESVDYNSLASLQANPDIVVPTGSGFYGCRLLLETHTYPTDDINVRKALNFAVDRQMVVDSVLAGQGAPIWGGMIPKGRFGYAPDLANTYSYDPAKAKELLAQAGWTDTDGDGYVDKDGKDMNITFIDYGPDWWSQVAEVVQANLKDIGVKVDLQIFEWATYKAKRSANQEIPAGQPGIANILGGTIWGMDLVDMMTYNVTGGYYNFARVSNPELDALYLKARSTIDDTQREALMQQARAIEVGNAYDITVAWISRAEAIRSYVKNFQHLNEDGCWGDLLWEAYLDK